MCGRYRLSRGAEVLATYYSEYDGMDWDARYNIAPNPERPHHQAGREGANSASFSYAPDSEIRCTAEHAQKWL
jgi:hypothetical protein